MNDETIICKGKVTGVNAQYQYTNLDGSGHPIPSDLEPISTITLDKDSFSSDVSLHNPSSCYVQTTASQIFVMGVLVWGEEYEVIVRKVKKVLPEITYPAGNRKFSDEEEIPF